MKKKEDSSFQLLFTALVLVIIAIGGTLAWFAHNSTSSVDQLAASITAPTDDHDDDGEPLFYCLEGEDDFSQYDGDLNFVPGMKALFRVEITPGHNAHIKLVMNEEPALGDVMKIRFYDSWSSNTPYPSASSITDVFNDELTEDANANEYVITHSITAADNSGYAYFFLYMDSSAGNSYMDQNFDFIVRVTET